MIVITGASGQLGRLVIQKLLQKTAASNIVAAVRDVEKAQSLAALGVQVRHADYSQPATLDAAFKDAEKILLISSNALGQRVAQHRNVIDAAKRADVKLLAYTSVLHADTSPLGLAREHRETEASIHASGLPFTLLRNGWYVENYTAHLQPALQHGAVLGSAGDGKISAAGRADYADAAVAVLTADNRPDEVYELAGEHAFTLSELAAEVTRQSGKTVVYKDMPEAEFKTVLLGIGMPPEIADLLSDSDSCASRGALYAGGDTLRKLTGHPTLTLQQGVQDGLKA